MPVRAACDSGREDMEASVCRRTRSAPQFCLLNSSRTVRGLATVLLLVAAMLLPAAAPAARADGPDWLQLINGIRTADGLLPVTVNDAWTAGIVAHLRYVRLTPGGYRTGMWASNHLENPQSPYYTPDGAAAGQSSDLVSGGASSDVAAIKLWLAAPFHAIGMLRPGLTQVAFARDPDSGAAGLDILRGLTGGATQSTAIEFPAPGTTTDLPIFGGEVPSPLETCHYTAAGLPIVVLLPADPASGLVVDLTGPSGTTISGPGDDLCLVGAANYTSSDPIYGSTGEAILQGDHAVLIIPRHGLTAGTYSVHVRQPGQAEISWSFTSAPPPARASLRAWRTNCGSTGTGAVQIEGVVDGDWAAAGGADRSVMATIGATPLSGFTLHADYAGYNVDGSLEASAPLLVGSRSLVITVEDPITSATVVSATLPLAGCFSTPTALTIGAPASIAYGSSLRITGRLLQASGVPLASAAVTLYARAASTASWSAVLSGRTNAAGTITFVRAPRANTQFQLRFAGSSTADPSASVARTVTVVPVVSATLSTASIALGNSATLAGTVTPSAPGGTVKLQELKASAWVTVAYATLSATSRYSFRLPTAARGSFQFRVYRGADATHGTAVSASRRLTVT
jgi:hypothetical protein